VRVLLLVMLLAGCAPKRVAPEAAWVLFDVIQTGTFWPIGAAIWPADDPDAVEYVIASSAEHGTRFYGLGQREGGYATTFAVGQSIDLRVWSPGHEIGTLGAVLRRGENRFEISLRQATVPDGALPETIRVEAGRRLPPPSKPLSGS
jgi:hypothetical protein